MTTHHAVNAHHHVDGPRKYDDQEINASPTEPLECVQCRRDGEAAVKLAIEPVEKPETVSWVDPTHAHGAV
jgi:uncharacterized RmlC-like cupin family protein